MAAERIRIEIGFDGGQIMSALVDEATWDELERQVMAGGPGVHDGRGGVLEEVKRLGREGRCRLRV